MSMIDLRSWRHGAHAKLGALAAGAILWSAVPGTASADAALADLVERVSPSVVTVFTTQEAKQDRHAGQPFGFPEGSPFDEFFRRFGFPDGMPGQGNAKPRQALGSGFILDSDGYVITNNHVVEDASTVKVKLVDRREFSAEVIGTDPQTDLALLKIDAGKDLPSVVLGDSDKLRVGEDVVAVGNPFGLGGTVTSGIISAIGRDIDAGPYVDFIQTDAAINRGNSGGPLFDVEGRVIGVNSAIISPSGGSVGVGFAIPSNIVKTVVADLKANGSVARGWLGVSIQTVTPGIAEAMGLDEPTGALVATVAEDGPSSGTLKAGDVILGFNGAAVTESRDLPKLVGATRAGTVVGIDILRKGDRESVEVKIGALPGEKHASSGTDGGESASDRLGARLAALSPRTRSQLGLDESVSGAVITSVDDDGAAAAAGLRPGDVIVQVGSEPVAGPGELTKALELVETPSALLLVNRRGDQLFLGVKLAA
ncbi:MAG TPA: Do family serine endopeptidase [Thermohalobaculum sp.]|nr:Do family serine endopeptidase [Thermohalobaculum sp.]